MSLLRNEPGGRAVPTEGRMLSGPKGRLFGFRPYSAAVRGFGELAPLRTHPVELRDGAIWLSRAAA